MIRTTTDEPVPRYVLVTVEFARDGLIELLALSAHTLFVK